MWTPTDTAFPENNTVVNTLSRGGQEAELLFSDGLWFLPDRSMYVYYVPILWKALA